MRRLLFSLLLVPLPLVVAAALLWAVQSQSLTDLTPIWSDELYYWHQAATFREFGLNSGYYTYNENPASIGPFYAWGLFIPALYGVLGRLFGWSLASIPLINLLFFGAGLAVFTVWLRLSVRQMVALLVALATFTPLLLLHTASMIELLQMALALLIAAMFVIILRRRERDEPIGRPFIVWAMLAIMLAALTRYSWVLLVVPLLWLAVSHNTRWWRWVIVLISLACILMSWLATSLTAAPYSDFLGVLLSSPPSNMVALMLNKVQENANLFLRGELPEISLRLRIVGFLIIMAVPFVYLRFWRRAEKLLTREVALHLYNLGGMLLLNILLYDLLDWRDYRVLAPHFLVSILLLVGRQRYTLLLVVIISALPLLPNAWQTYVRWTSEQLQPHKRANYEEWRAKYPDVLVYLPDAPSPWCNTVLHTPYYAFVPTSSLLAVPPGFGLSVALPPDNLPLPPRSRYLLLDVGIYERFANRLNVEKLMNVPGGALFLNRESLCRLPLTAAQAISQSDFHTTPPAARALPDTHSYALDSVRSTARFVAENQPPAPSPAP